MNDVLENRTVGLVGSSAAAHRIADALAGLGIRITLMRTACFRGRPSSRSAPDALLVACDDLAEIAAVRRRWKKTPILVVSDNRELKARALCVCADDAVGSEIEMEELCLRIAVAIRRSETSRADATSPKEFNGLVLDENSNTLVAQERRIRLTPRQASIMSVLRSHVEHNPIPLSRIFQAVCSADTRSPNHETIRVHISMLNKKLASIADARVRIRCSQDGYYVQAAA